MEELVNVKYLLGIDSEDSTKDTLLITLISLSRDKVLALLNGLTQVPKQLQFIVIELTVNRFNKLGSEGITSEAVAEISRTYSSENDIAPYMHYINEYNKASKAKFRFL